MISSDSDSEDYCDDLILLDKFDTVDTANSVDGDSLFSDDDDKTDYQYYCCNGNSCLSTQTSLTFQFLFYFTQMIVQ